MGGIGSVDCITINSGCKYWKWSSVRPFCCTSIMQSLSVVHRVVYSFGIKKRVVVISICKRLMKDWKCYFYRAGFFFQLASSRQLQIWRLWHGQRHSQIVDRRIDLAPIMPRWIPLMRHIWVPNDAGMCVECIVLNAFAIETMLNLVSS